MKYFLVLLVVLGIAGCNEEQATIKNVNTPLIAPSPPPEILCTTKIISDPPGARIEIDNDFKGDAPLEIQWYGARYQSEPNGRIFFTEEHEVKALPIYGGHFVQGKFFWSRHAGRPDEIPKTIFFDMRLGPSPKQYDVDITNK